MKELREYIETDEIYKDYKKRYNDFERYCIKHCEEIEEMIYENEEMKKRIEKGIEFLKREYNSYASAKEWREALERTLRGKE